MRKLFWLVLLLAMLAACSKEEPRIALKDLPDGDRLSGAKLFSQSIEGVPPCSSCHSVTTVKQVGPGLAGFGERAENSVSGQDAPTYTYYSILRPSRHVVNGYSNVMPSNYEEVLGAQDLADLIAYLLSL